MASKEFRFHYVKTPTGAISGQSVLTQTEDAINNLGDYMVEATGDATEALTKATEALNTANNAQQNAAEALSTANSALGKVNTLSDTVNTFDGRIKTAESNAANAVTTSTEASNNAAQAVTTANSANKTAQQAVTTANDAKTTAQNANASAAQAVGTANAANATAGEAKRIALQAVTDTDAIREEINQNMAVMTEKVTEATTQAQNSAGSAGESKASSELSKKWATWTTGVQTEAGTVYTVDSDGYSSKWNAQLAQAWAVKTDGKVTENNLPDGAEIDYSAKYYAQQSKASADAAAESARQAAESAKQAAAGQIQADWNQSDSAQKDFIKNKPDLSIYATATALSTGLAGKANTSHTHTIANVTDLQTTLDGKIPKTGNRGALAGYSTSAVGTTVDASANDSQYATSGTVTVKNGATGQAWTKVVKMSAGSVALGSNWAWVDGEAPELSFPCLLICHWNNDKGIAGVVKGAA